MADNDSTPPLFDSSEVNKSDNDLDNVNGLNVDSDKHQPPQQEDDDDDDDDIFASAIQVYIPFFLYHLTLFLTATIIAN